MADDAALSFLRASGVGHVEACAASLEALPDNVPWLAVLDGVGSVSEAVIQWQRLTESHPQILAQWETEFGSRFPLAIRRLSRIFGHSRALGDYIIADPDRVHTRWLFNPISTQKALDADHIAEIRRWLHSIMDVALPENARILLTCDEHKPMPVIDPATEQAHMTAASVDLIRGAYRQCLLGIACADLATDTPLVLVDQVGYAMASLVDATLNLALQWSRQRNPDHAHARMSIIAMGKTGAEELNYISDVDVVYVCADTESDPHHATVLANDVAALVSGIHPHSLEEPLWVLDTALRPEGKDGALVRTLPSYISYWEKWAQTWEFQALLKARGAAGDDELAQEFHIAAQRYIWTASGRPDFVQDARAMRKRVEGTVPSKEATRELKLGKGGLRDVEFSVQMLQLVHGRTDASLQTRATLAALAALCDGGYVNREDARELDEHYRFLRCVEHRTQLLRMRRTHVLPAQASALRIVARSLGYAHGDELMEKLRSVRARVRALHEDMFYRPIVEATAQLSVESVALARDLHGEGALAQEAAQDRLASIGFVDTRGAFGHIRALCHGTSRRAQIQRHLLPVFLGWLADSVDPDLGLLHFRTLSDCIGDSHWYLGLLRDSNTAAERLLRALARSKWLAHSLELRPEAVKWLDNDEELQSRDLSKLRSEVAALVERRPDAEDAALRVRAVRARELTRCALFDVTFGVAAINHAISDATDIALEGALAIAQREDRAVHGDLVDLAFIAMGRYGGRESGYASDADVIVAHEALPGVDETTAAHAATRIAHRVQALLGTTASHIGVTVDADLRPEGKNGSMSRTPQAYEEYYSRWAATWERQALLRARPAAGSAAVADKLMPLIDSIRYGQSPTDAQVQEIRLMKARMERERLPRGVEPTRHVKLGPGGLSDVEWTIQLIQLRHGHAVQELRTPSTIDALDAALAAGLLGVDEAVVLRQSWMLASQIRAANVLVTGRGSGQKLDVLTRDRRELAAIARVLGYESGQDAELEEDWLRAARQARKVMEDLFWV